MTAFLATKIQAKKKATWIHDEKPYWMKSVQKYLCEYDKIYGVSQAVVDAFCREYPHYKDKAAVFYNVIDKSTFIIWPMEKRIKKNEKSSQHGSQNSYFSPLAEMASEAKM